MEAFLCGRNSSSFPVSHISTPCSLGCIIHHISPLFISLSITFCHLLEPHKVSIIIIIVIIIVIIIIKHTSIFGREDWGPYGLLLPHLLPSLWFFLRCLCGMPGFISELWHLNQDSDLGPNSTSGVPQGTTSAVSTTAEEAAEICKDILRISKTFWENRGNSVTCRLKTFTGTEYLGWSYAAACRLHKPSFGQDLMFMVWAAGSLTYPGWRATGLAQTEPDWRSAR